MKKILLGLSIILFVQQLSHAQNQDAYKLYKMESIYLVGTNYIKNGVKYPIGVFGSHLGREMQVSQHAISEWKTYNKYRGLSLLTSLTGLALTLSALYANEPDDRRNLLLGGLGITVLSIPISVKANSHLQKAVWTRNRDLFQY